jgi:hypothetical protein
LGATLLNRLSFDPFGLLLIALAGAMNQQHRDVIDYLFVIKTL